MVVVARGWLEGTATVHVRGYGAAGSVRARFPAGTAIVLGDLPGVGHGSQMGELLGIDQSPDGLDLSLYRPDSGWICDIR